ncbi:MAG: TetR/AcrR family transcriptional regulator [Bacillota bacterium]
MEIRERILEGFKRLAFERGFHATTVDELSSRTGISKRTIYKYYRSKNELVMAVAENLMSSAERGVDSVLASPVGPVEKMAAVISILSEHLRNINPVLMNDMQKYFPNVWERIETFRAKKVRRIIEKLMSGENSEHFKDVIPEVFMTSLLSSVRDVLNPGFMVKNNLRPEDAALCLFEIFLYGIVSDKARSEQSTLLK